MEYGHCSGSATKLKQTRTPKGVGIAVLALGCCAVVTLPAGHVSAQVRIDDGAARPTPPPAEAAPVQPKPAEPVLVKPKPIDVHVLYPEDGEGNSTVVLEILVGIDGKVGEAQALEGEAPFTQAAIEATQHWRFEPATRDGEPFAARLRFAVEFTPPEPAPAEAVTLEAGAPKPAPQTARTGDSSTAKPQAPAGEDEAVDVLVTGERPEAAQSFSQAEVRELPGAFGDPFRAIEAMPGVVPIVSGLPYFYVRGAPPGNVGYYFDGIPVPLLYHFGVGPGVLHPAFVERVDLHAGAYPARFGRYAGGVVSGEIAAPKYETRGEASLRLVDSGGFLEAPFAEGRGSVMVGGRYSYTGALASAFSAGTSIDYWDYQGRVRYDLDPDDSVELLGFGSADFFAEDTLGDGVLRSQFDVNFHRIDVRWEHRWQSGRFRQAALVGVDHSVLDERTVRFTNRLAGARFSLLQELGQAFTLRGGVDALVEALEQRLNKPASEIGSVDSETDAEGNVIESPTAEDSGLDFDTRRTDLVVGSHADVVIDISERLSVTPGVRGDFYRIGNREAVGFEPRLSTRYTLNDRVVLSHALGLAHQPPSFLVPIPGAKPGLEGGLQRALQHSAGAEFVWPAGFSSSAVLFHNLFFNMTDPLGLTQLAENADVNEEALRTDGYAYGAELMLRRSSEHRLGGMLSYTLSRSVRRSGNLSGPAGTDRTHVLNAATSYDLGRHWRLGSRVLLYSGKPAQMASVEAAQSPQRTPLFWRLDWQLQKRWPSADQKGYWGLVVEVLNTTLNREVTSRDCTTRPCINEQGIPLFIPSIGVEAAF